MTYLSCFSENIDEDLQASKKIVDDIQHKRSETEQQFETSESKKRENSDDVQVEPQEAVYGSVLRDPEEFGPARLPEMDEKSSGLKNITESRAKTNNWPEFKQNDQQFGSVRTSYLDEHLSQMKFHSQATPVNRNRHRQFEYRVVTDRPFIHSKTPKAYIAVSVIAPKPMEPQDDDFLLESELRQLKPWPLRQDYQDMEPLQTRWAKKAQQDADDRSLQ